MQIKPDFIKNGASERSTIGEPLFGEAARRTAPYIILYRLSDSNILVEINVLNGVD